MNRVVLASALSITSAFLLVPRVASACGGTFCDLGLDGHEVYVPNVGPWPDFSEEMPYAEEIAAMPPAGAPMTTGR
jgi:hypothetical protein